MPISVAEMNNQLKDIFLNAFKYVFNPKFGRKRWISTIFWYTLVSTNCEFVVTLVMFALVIEKNK